MKRWTLQEEGRILDFIMANQPMEVNLGKYILAFWIHLVTSALPDTHCKGLLYYTNQQLELDSGAQFNSPQS